VTDWVEQDGNKEKAGKQTDFKSDGPLFFFLTGKIESEEDKPEKKTSVMM